MIQSTLERSDPNNEYGKRTLASYDWIDLTAPEGYAPLAANLDPEFDPDWRKSDVALGSSESSAESFDAFIVALPDKIYYPADAIDKWSQRVATWLPSFWGGNEERVELRRYFITTLSELRKHARDNQSLLGNNLVGLTMQLDTAQFVWLVEYCSVEQWEQGRVAARAIVDATASPQSE